MSVAFFDLDRTLIAENSAKLWLRAQWKARKINLAQMIGASYWLTKYHLGFTKMEDVIQRGLTILEGESYQEIMDQTKDFYESTICHLYRPGAMQALELHRDKKHKISLLTSSFDGLSKLVQHDLKLDFCLCTNLEIDPEGIYTGRTIGPPCFGPNKIKFAQNLCQEIGVDLKNCVFYTDSASDIPLLNLVGKAVAVNPDPHLRARAQLKKWQVVDWGRPT